MIPGSSRAHRDRGDHRRRPGPVAAADRRGRTLGNSACARSRSPSVGRVECRITTEIRPRVRPASGAFGLPCAGRGRDPPDEGSAYVGAEVLPYYDSLLLKLPRGPMTSPPRSRACTEPWTRSDPRGLDEPGVPQRGAEHPEFQAGRTTRRSSTSVRGCPRSAPVVTVLQDRAADRRGDRRSAVRDRVRASRCPRQAAAARRRRATAGSRQRLQELGPRHAHRLAGGDVGRGREDDGLGPDLAEAIGVLQFRPDHACPAAAGASGSRRRFLLRLEGIVVVAEPRLRRPRCLPDSVPIELLRPFLHFPDAHGFP